MSAYPTRSRRSPLLSVAPVVEPFRAAIVARPPVETEVSHLAVFVEVASAMLEMPVAWITGHDGDGERLLAATGEPPAADELGRGLAFCARTFRDAVPLTVGDTHRDPRASAGMPVVGSPAIRSFAGVALLGRDGARIGALSVFGRTPRGFTRAHADVLKRLAALASAALEAPGSEGERAGGSAAVPQAGYPDPWSGWLCLQDGSIQGADGCPEWVGGAFGGQPASNWTALIHPLQRDEVVRRWRRAAGEGSGFVADFRSRDDVTPVVWLRVGLRPLEGGGDGRAAGGEAPETLWSGSLEIVDRLHPHQPALHDPSLCDTLTGLVNRRRFQVLLDRAVQDARLGIQFALLCLDLDDFKLVNDTFGHTAGDRILQTVGERLASCLGHGDVAGRLGGDEFLVIQTCVELPSETAGMARRLMEHLSRPITIDGHVMTIGVSVGIALGPRDGKDSALLFRHADLAMYRAKLNGKGAVCLFDPTMDAAAGRLRGIAQDLRDAIERSEFRVEYQPIMSLHDGRVVSFEALLRWHHPVRGIVPPAEFIPVAETAGLIHPIGAWVMRRACQDAVSWPSDVRLAVNLSPRQFASAELTTLVPRILAETGLAPERLELEITETLPLLQNDRNLLMLRRLRDLGVKLVLDDFGTGYSSLAYLSNFQFDRIKLDRVFINAMSQPQGLAIARSIIRLAADLEIPVTAEGIETMQQLEQVTGEGCSEAQGFLIARPMPASRIAAALFRIRTKFRPATGPAPGPGKAALPGR